MRITILGSPVGAVIQMDQSSTAITNSFPTAGVEKAPVTVYSSSKLASHAIAREIADLIGARQAVGEKAVLGLATGSTPLGVYSELIRLHQQEALSFRNVVTFNLDEYFPMQPTELQSY